MAVRLDPLNYDRFKGIREFNGVNSGGEISALICDNVELVQTEIGGTTGIKSMSGNATLYTLPDNGFNIKGVFASEQDNIIYKFIYAENDTVGRLYYVNIDNQPEAITDSNDDIIEFTLTGKCNGLTMSSSAYDVFIFTNGEEAYSICFTNDSNYPYDTAQPINFTMTPGNPPIKTYKTDYEGKDIKFLAMAIWNGRLVVATDYGVRASHDNDIYTWNDNPKQEEASSWYINYTEKVTALYAYTGGLFIFTDDNTDFLNGNPNASSSMLQTTAGVGCHSYTSIVKHDTYLFFYSNIQKNIYMIQNIDNGQTRPTGPLAKEVQSAFKDVKNIKLYSCIYDNKNEIWCLITDNNNKFKLYIYNYNLGEWVTRSGMAITSVCMVNNSVLTSLGGKVYNEYINNTFDGQNITSVYETCYINAGSNTNLKKQKTPLLIVLNDSYTNDFFVQLTVNGKPKSEKRIKLGSSAAGVYGSTEEVSDIIPDNQIYGSAEDELDNCAHYGEYNPYSKKVVEVSTPQTWYTMNIKIFTKSDIDNQGFYIYSMELKNMKAKLKTKGR